MKRKPNETIENNFKHHSVTGTQMAGYDRVQATCKELAYILDTECPNSREKSVAMTHLETTMFWANAAIDRN